MLNYKLQDFYQLTKHKFSYILKRMWFFQVILYPKYISVFLNIEIEFTHFSLLDICKVKFDIGDQMGLKYGKETAFHKIQREYFMRNNESLLCMYTSKVKNNLNVVFVMLLLHVHRVCGSTGNSSTETELLCHALYVAGPIITLKAWPSIREKYTGFSLAEQQEGTSFVLCKTISFRTLETIDRKSLHNSLFF
ncbi:uncharacterized protein LOC143257923 isoform X3 [Tachypleus tridentatus]